MIVWQELIPARGQMLDHLPYDAERWAMRGHAVRLSYHPSCGWRGWVATYDDGEPMPGAPVGLVDESGNVVWQAPRPAYVPLAVQDGAANHEA